MEPQTNNQIEQARSETLEQAVAFEELVRTKGWDFVKANYQTKVQGLATMILTSDKPMEEFESERQQVIGLRNLIGFIDDALNFLNDERKKPATTATE